MASHPGERKRHFPEELPVSEGLIRRPLEENDDWYRDLIEHSRDLLCVHDLEGRLLSINPGPARLLGYSVEEMLRKPMRDLVDPQFRAEFDIYLREIERTGESHGLMAVITRSGEQRIWEYHNTLRTDGVTKPVVRGIAHDVTERVRAEKALRTSNQQLLTTAAERERTIRELTLFRTLLDQSNDAIKVIDPQTLRFLDVNEKACAELGYSRDELLSMTVYDIDPTASEGLVARVRQQWRDSGFAIMETVHRRKDGTMFPVEVNMRKVRLDREYSVSISRDITERKRAEERLKEFERVVENLEEMIVVVNRDRRYLLANRAALRYRGMSKEQLIGRHVTEVVEPELYEMTVKSKLDESFAGHIVSYEGQSEYPGLGVRDIACTYLPIESSTGIDRVACVLRDITERKRSEEALRETNEQLRKTACEQKRTLHELTLFRTLLDQAHDAIEVMDPETLRFFDVNERACVALGYSREELLSMTVYDIDPEYDGSSRERVRQQMRKSGFVIMERMHRRKDGTMIPVEVNMRRVRLNREYSVAVSRDITERKQTEKVLRESELRFRTVYERSPIGIALVDSRTGRFLQVNPKYCEIAGRSEEELVGIDVRSITHPDDIGQTSEHLQQLDKEKATGFVTDKRYLRPDGSVRWVRVQAVPMWRHGETHRWQMGLVEDITERRQAEEKIATLVQQLGDAKKKLTEEKIYLEQEIDTELGFGEIIGQSKALQGVKEQVDKVACSDATVLLLGETGTGKELVARAIHRLSRRASNSFIKLNCAAIPSGLLESELFGNEKGAFTGAVSKKIGRLELADEGTLFLDEIGEISLALQPKLLRVLQDQEFERLGGTQTLKVDFRLIAATNRDLADSVRENEFRSDLFYRLNVFPIRVPPLRERREDIRLLVEHFVQKFAQRMNKSITHIPKETMDGLMAWDWPGNVRELENFIERSVILTQGSVLVSPLGELQPMAEGKTVDETLEATEREHILRALRDSHGQIGGPRGAAMRLGLNRTTLQSKMKRLGINVRPRPTAH